jgi:hypothetical protein
MSIPVYYTAAPDERLKIIDSVGNEFYLPSKFEIRSEPIAKKQGLMDVAFAHGARDVSDGKMTTRTIEVTGKIWAATDAAYNTAWDNLAKEIIKENFKLQDRGRQINVLKIAEINHAFPSQVNYRYGEVSINFLCIDPFWYAVSAKSKQFGPTPGSPLDIFQFDVLGNIEVYPVITILNQANNTDFTLEAVTDGAKSFRIQDAGALTGTTIEVDCALGTVKRGSTNIIDKFSGFFLRLLGGRENKFHYTGADCTITFNFKEAWL